MKIRTGFVSNSSSASFIVKFKTDRAQEEVQEHLDLIYNIHKWTKKDKYEKLIYKDGEYSINPETSMFNDWYDILEWPFIRMLQDVDPSITGYHLVEIREVEEEYSCCNHLVTFDPEPWEAYYINNPGPDKKKGERIKEKKEYEEKLREIEGQYLNYLYSMGLPVDDKLLLLDYKFSQ